MKSKITPQAMDLYQEFINHKEWFNSAEYAFCLHINPEETKQYLIRMEPCPIKKESIWINMNVYSEWEKEEYDFRMERGL